MDRLIDKYKRDGLSPDELSELRVVLDSMTDEEIGQRLYADWQADDGDVSFVDEGRVAGMKNRIDIATGRGGGRPRLSPPVRWLRVAAAVLLPVSILCTAYFYHRSNLIYDREILVTTGKTERAGVTLPDGTAISLNMGSELKYSPQDYNRKERAVGFSGEGYFQVSGNRKAPFLINVNGMQVKVTGTAFNLSAREGDDTAELSLEEGCVSLLSTGSNQTEIVHENQRAILDRSTGNITVVNDENVEDVSAWRHGDVIFRNAGLSEVIGMMEEYYDVVLKIDYEECFSDRFSGILPIDNLNEALTILEYAYHLKAVKENNVVVMTGN